MVKPKFEHDGQLRQELLAELGAAVRDRKPHRLYFERLRDFYADREPGDRGEPPTGDDIPGLTFKVAAILDSDFTHIFIAKRPEGVYGSQYERGYIRMREAARRPGRIKKFLADAEKRMQEERDAADPLRAMLDLNRKD